jgi:hypothetical protein
MHGSALRFLSPALLLAAAPLLLPQQPQGPKAPSLPASVFLMPSGKTLVMPNSDGGCEAIDVASGKPQWSVARVTQILGVNRDRLLVIRLADDKPQHVRVVALDPASGKSLSVSGDFTFRADLVWEAQGKDFPVPPSKDSRIWSPVSSGGYTLSVRPLLQKDQLFLVWQARDVPTGGAPRPGFGGAGIVRVDLESGKAVALAKGDKLPKEAKALDRGEGTVQPADGLQFRVTFRPGRKVPGAIITQRFLEALRDGKVRWERALGSPMVQSLAP